jgi:predicted ABC-type transport system involved in lysophospholipase L1 biosynthesis ATPase subunit
MLYAPLDCKPFTGAIFEELTSNAISRRAIKQAKKLKTTLISIIAAILEPDSGRCEVLGHDWRHLSQNERASYRGVAVGFVFQLFNLLPALTAVENVAIPLLINGLSRRHAEARAKEKHDADFFTGLGYWTRANPEQCLMATRGAKKARARGFTLRARG